MLSRRIVSFAAHSSRFVRKMASFSSDDKLARVRAVLARENLSAVIVGSEDAHQSEYVSDSDARREYISNFTGSAGTAVVTTDAAYLWTDGRYFLQASQELSPAWTLMRAGEKGVPTLEDFLGDNMTVGSRVGVDPYLISASGAQTLASTLSKKKVQLVATKTNVIDEVWSQETEAGKAKPAVPQAPVVVHPVTYAGQSLEQKLVAIREALSQKGAEGIIISALDEVAWTLNLRGSDVTYNPVFISYLLITSTTATLFIDAVKITEEAGEQLKAGGVEVRPYEEAASALSSLSTSSASSSEKPKKILADLSLLNWALHLAVVGEKEEGAVKCEDTPSIIAKLKTMKNDAEIAGIKQAHVRDGVSLSAFLHWLETTTASGADLTECTAADKLEQFRQSEPQNMFVGLSFPTIAGFGSNGAIIHYRPEPSTCKKVDTSDLFLVDSGAQYRDGTTDITRTIHLGTPTERHVMCFTLVLKGHIQIALATYPEDTMGSRIDAIARMALWKHGLDYNHGTGHGVGAYMNVHEGPQSIGYRKRANEMGLMLGMTTSNEPGYYENGSFGIRIENVCIMQERAVPNHFNSKKYIGMETVSFAPIQKKLIDVSLLADDELEWLNNYHMQVRETLLAGMTERYPESVEWLIQATEPLVKA